MLSDRPYMRDDYQREKTSVVVWLICAIVAAFIIEVVFFSPRFAWGADVFEQMAVTIPGLRAGHLWILLTHSFLHDPHNLFHVIGAVIGLYFFGNAVLPVLGPKRFLGFYASALCVSSLTWALVNWRHGGMFFGAMAAVNALFVFFACLHPNDDISLLLFFVLPVRLKPKTIVFVWGGLELLGFFFYEIFGAASPFDFAPSAHLGGMAFGWFYYRFLYNAKWRQYLPRRRTAIELPGWVKKKQASAPPAAYQVNLTDRGNLRAEVDRILDKINSRGFAALTPEEKRTLDEARDLLSRH
jgi:membrane associated rhomboid family serine protease